MKVICFRDKCDDVMEFISHDPETIGSRYECRNCDNVVIIQFNKEMDDRER